MIFGVLLILSVLAYTVSAFFKFIQNENHENDPLQLDLDLPTVPQNVNTKKSSQNESTNMQDVAQWDWNWGE